MTYSNTFLRDFAPVFHGILQRLEIKTNLLAVEVVDEEEEPTAFLSWRMCWMH